MDNADFFKNKNITLMGLGLLGRGVGDAIFLAKAGANLTVTDLKTERELATSVRKLKKFKNIKLVLGRHRPEDFRLADMVIKAAGVPIDSSFVAEAEKNKVPVVMSTALFARLSGVKSVGITGTRGKSTVTDMIFQIFKTLQKNDPKARAHAKRDGKIFLGGNIRGISTLSLLPKVRHADLAVLELDSWQLQGFNPAEELAWPGISPRVAVFTTFMPDHLNYYAGDMSRYFADKANIYRLQTADDVLVVSEQVLEFIEKFGPKPASQMIVVRSKDLSAYLPKSLKLKIPGEHNRLNAALAVAATLAAHKLNLFKSSFTTKEIIKISGDFLKSYGGLSGRLECITRRSGIEIYNDTNSTTPDATIAALESFPSKTAVLILGGADKKLEAKNLLKILPDQAKALVVLPGSGTEIIRAEIEKMATIQNLPVVFVATMAEAVQTGFLLAKKYHAKRLIMSPGFASFGLFKNEYDRGDQFVASVKKL